jgi:hypothetical protein
VERNKPESVNGIFRDLAEFCLLLSRIERTRRYGQIKTAAYSNHILATPPDADIKM